MGRIYLPPKCTYTVVGNHFETDGAVKNKVSGTAMAGILGISPWSSPFQVACSLLGLGREDISGKPAVSTGKILETPIIRYADKKWNKLGNFRPAEEYFEKREGDHDAWVSDFEDEIFAGHIDGVVEGADGECYVLEVKTSSNLDSWAEGVPDYYFWQVALYNHFMAKRDKAFVVLGMVNEYTHRDPFSFVPGEGNVELFQMDINDAEVSAKMDEIREWYNTYIANGVTPDYDPENPGDVELYEHLCLLARDIESMRGDLDRLAEVEETIAEYENAKNDLYTEREMLKSNLKQYLIANKLTNLETKDRMWVAKIGTQERSSINTEQMAIDGIDVSKYKEAKIVKTFSIKKSKLE